MIDVHWSIKGDEAINEVHVHIDWPDLKDCDGERISPQSFASAFAACCSSDML
jgi:hypothetical protein